MILIMGEAPFIILSGETRIFVGVLRPYNQWA
jgi:hypothetical protein